MPLFSVNDLKQKGNIEHITEPYQVVNQKVMESRIYQLVRFSLSEVSTGKRRRIVQTILSESGAIGLIEWWTKGSIVKKPKSHFYAILVFKAAPAQ